MCTHEGMTAEESEGIEGKIRKGCNSREIEEEEDEIRGNGVSEEEKKAGGKRNGRWGEEEGGRGKS